MLRLLCHPYTLRALRRGRIALNRLHRSGPHHEIPVNLLFAVFALLLAPQTINQLEPHNVKLAAVEYRGRQAIQVIADPNAANGESYAALKGAAFHNGTIEVDLAGKPAEGAGAGARGFIGIAFPLKQNQYEYVYLRPTNGRAPDQVRADSPVVLVR